MPHRSLQGSFMLRPARQPNVAGIQVPSFIRCLLDLLTIRRITPPPPQYSPYPPLARKAARATTSATSPTDASSAPTPMSHPALTSQLPLIERMRQTLPVSLPLPWFALTGPDLTTDPAIPQPDVVVTQKYPSPPMGPGHRPLSTIWRSLIPRTLVSPCQSHLAFLLWCSRMCYLLWPDVCHSTPRGHRSLPCHRSSCPRIVSNRILMWRPVSLICCIQWSFFYLSSLRSLLRSCPCLLHRRLLVLCYFDVDHRSYCGAATLDAATDSVVGDDSVSDRTGPARATSHSAPGVDPATSTGSHGRTTTGFDASASPATTKDHPLITIPRHGCPYRVTSYRDDDHSSLDSPFSLQVHHPRFLSG